MEDFLAATVVSFLLVAICLYLHFKVLRNAAWVAAKLDKNVRQQMLLVMALIFLIHLTEIILFAVAYWMMIQTGMGSFAGAYTSTAADFFYFSIGSYTTLGMGDILPEGPIRVVAGIEALTGLLLIAWSASFTYLTMERIWAPIKDSD